MHVYLVQLSKEFNWCQRVKCKGFCLDIISLSIDTAWLSDIVTNDKSWTNLFNAVRTFSGLFFSFLVHTKSHGGGSPPTSQVMRKFWYA